MSLDPGQETETKVVCHASMSAGSAKTILQGIVKGKRRCRQKKRWGDNTCIKKWTEMEFAITAWAVNNRIRWKGIVAKSSVVPRRPFNVT